MIIFRRIAKPLRARLFDRQNRRCVYHALANRTLTGDTLIEVTLAIGVLSFLVIGISTTMISSLAVSQNNLEETMAQTEIDIQAEALRYIHNAYAAQRQFKEENQEYRQLWLAIKDMAVTPSTIASLNSVANCYVFYDPTGDSIYGDSEKSFVINAHRLDVSYLRRANGSFKDKSELGDIVVKSASNDPQKSPFQPAGLYPRILYGDYDKNDTILEESNNGADNLYLAEGIWVTAVCSDTNTAGTKCADQPQYYDFYIRTCWNSNTPHGTDTVGTIIRLHNPDLTVKDNEGSSNPVNSDRLNYTIYYHANGGPFADGEISGSCNLRYASSACYVQIGYDNIHSYGSYIFNGWKDADGNSYSVGQTYGFRTGSSELHLYAQWAPSPRIYFNGNDCNSHTAFPVPNTAATVWNGYNFSAVIDRNRVPVREKFIFLGWSTQSRTKSAQYQPGDTIIASRDTTLYAVWRPEVTYNVAFLIDSTGSMSGLINSYKREALTLATTILGDSGKVALIEYRDVNVDFRSRTLCNFSTCTLSSFSTALNGISVGGGGDFPESVLEAAYNALTNLTWNTGALKYIIVLTDASYLNPDGGVTESMVLNKAREIGDVNFYFLTSVGQYYQSLATQTNGKVFSTSLSDLGDSTDAILNASYCPTK